MSIDEAVRRAAPITDDELEGLGLDALEAELREAIVARPVRRRPSRDRRRLLPAAGALLAAASAALIVFLSSGGGTDRAWAAELVRVAEAVPRLLADGWQVTRADQWAVDSGEMEFGDGARTVQLSWRRGELAPGKPGILAWKQDGYVLELRGEASAEVRKKLRAVSVDEWLSAMPVSVVKPSATDAVVDTMLSDLPLPPGFDRAAVDTGGDVRDRYQLGARVTAAVTCGWIKTWLEGDPKERTEAVAALATADRWTVLKEMAREGDYDLVVRQYAEAIAGNGTVVGGKTLTVAESYEDALGC